MATELGVSMLEIMVSELFDSEFQKNLVFFSYLEDIAIDEFYLVSTLVYSFSVKLNIIDHSEK